MQYLPFTEAEVMNACRTVFPAAIQSFVISIITELYTKATSTAILSVTLVATLWSSSKGFLSIIRGMNGVYANTETRNYIVIRIKSAIYTILFALMIILFLVIFVFGNQLYLWIVRRFPVFKEFALVIISLRTIVGLCLLIAFFLFIFMAILASCGWMIFSYLFSFYIDNMSNYSYTYGSLTAIVLCMVWLYTCMYMMFIGAEVNSVLANPTVLAALKKLFSKNSFEE